MADTFISYRREDTAGYAGRLCEALEERLGDGRVFRDVDTLEPGDDFVRAIGERVRRCEAFLALIGRQWSDARDAAGRRRLEQEHDYVRLEIEAALRRPDLLVVPVLVEGTAMPPPPTLPPSIAGLANRHAISLRDDTWDADVDRLAELIGRKTRVGPAPPAVRTQPDRRAVRWWPAAAIAAITLGLVAIFLWTRGDSTDGQAEAEGGARETVTASRQRAGAPSPPPTPAASFPAYAIRVPRVAEVAQGSLLYSLVSGSLGPHGSANELRLRFRVSNEGRYPANLWDASFRLRDNGDILTPTSGLNVVLDGRSIREGIVTFDVPPRTERATLRIGEGDKAGEIPLDLLPTGRPAEDEQAPAGDALTRAITFYVQRDPTPLVAAGDIAVTVRSVTGRRFANLVRLRVNVSVQHKGRSPWFSGDLTVRAIVGESMIAPIEGFSEAIEARSTASGTYVFDVPPDTTGVTLRATLGEQSTDMPLAIAQ